MSNEAGMTAVVQAASVAFQAAVEDAYRRGYQAGIVAANEAASKAISELTISGDISRSDYNVTSLSVSEDNSIAPRARRGLAASAIAEVFSNETGLPVADIHHRAKSRGHDISVEAIGAELRRNEGKRYRRERKRWFPIIRDDGDRMEQHLKEGAPAG